MELLGYGLRPNPTYARGTRMRDRTQKTRSLDQLIDAVAAALGLPVEPEWKPAIKANLQVTLRLGVAGGETSSSPTRRSRHPCSRLERHGSLGTAAEIAAAVASGKTSALAVTEAALARIADRNKALNAFTAVTAERALAKARAIDADRAARQAARAARRACRSRSRTCSTWRACRRWPAPRSTAIARAANADATLIARLEAAGAVLVGALNMGEYAYDFTGENVHDGPSRNPHNTGHMTGGSSGGTGGAVAGGLVPFALGSDTNGSIRVPSSFCGLFGLKPTYGRLSRARTFPFVASLDHLGPLARTTADLALAYDAMQGHDAEDPACATRPVEPVLPGLGRGTRACASRSPADISARGASPEALAAVDRVAKALDATRMVEIPEAGRARAAAFVITATEGAALHLDRLRTRAKDFEPAVRDRLIAGAMVPALAGGQGAEVPPLVSRAGARAVPASMPSRAGHALPAPAHRPADHGARRRRSAAAAQHRHLHAADLLHRPACGSSARCRSTPLPIGVQIIAAPWREDVALRIAHALEKSKVVAAPRPAE